MIRRLLPILCFTLGACANDAYKLQVSNNLADAHGNSVYFRSSVRSDFAKDIRRALTNKFGEMGIKAATSPDNADYVAIFDIETFYKQENNFKDTSMANNSKNTVLFSTDMNSEAMYFSGNANMNTDIDKTCFTLNIGKKNTSNVAYSSTFCANEVLDTETFVPFVVDVYSKFATYRSANIGVQCLTSADGKISCDTINDRQKAFINSLWTNQQISED